VKKLEKKIKLKVSGLRRLKKVGTAQKVESSTDTVIDDQEDASKQGGIAKLDADEDVTLEEVAAITKDIDAQGRQEESQAQDYHIDLEHTYKVLSMQDDEPELAELKEAIKVVTTAKLMTEVVTATATTITAARVLKGEEKAGFKMDFFKGMSYDDIRPIFEKHFNSIVGFLEKGEEQLNEEVSKALKRKSESSEQQAAKKQKLDEEVPVVDYQIHSENNKPYYKIIRADGTHQMILLVERRYHLTRFTLDQMPNNVRLEVEEENFKEYTQRDYYCWLKTYYCWYKLKLLDNAVDSRLRLLEESAATNDKMKK
nr:hypothetical protein [Tanacetum cinerariifolium]